MKRILRTLAILAVVLMPAGFLCGQTMEIDYTTKLAIDPNVRIGELDNGLIYYIRKNVKPENRVELRLVVNAGSILENDDQQGLAHFTEHMCFNGTKTFPKNELIDFLQKTGVQFGADINAYTSFDQTVYMLQLPTDEEGLVEKGFQVLEDWAHDVTLDGKEIDKERGVIIEEWRLGLGAQDRMMKKFFPVILKGSLYAERLPIGKVEILESFKHETLRDFYRDWYRPDLQAVVVVGDVDPDWAEAQVKEHFAGLKNPDNPRERVVFDLPGNDEPLIAITTDPEAMQNVILMFWKHPVLKVKTLGGLKEQITAELFTGMLNQRFSEMSQKPDCPFVFASTGYGEFLVRTKDAYILQTMPKENQTEEALLSVLAENERVKQFGFTATEYERQKEDMLSRHEKAANEFDKTESARFAGAYVSNYLNETPIPGAKKEFKYLKKILPEITLEQVNDLAKKWVTEDNMAMVIMGPEKEGLKIPTEDEILAVVEHSRTKELEAWIDNFREEPLIPFELPGGKVVEKSENSELGFTELTLSNGVKVILKPTDFKNDEILIAAFSPGGNSRYEDDIFLSANFASAIIDKSGVGEFENVELQKKLKGKNISISPYIDEIKEGFRGSATPKDFKTLMELVWLYFDAPRKDTSAFQAFISQMENQTKFMKGNPVIAFYDTLFKTAYPENKRLVIFPTEEQIASIDLDEAFEIYTDRFADASDFTFIIVGNFSIDSITPLVETYFGSLPSIQRNETWLDRSQMLAPGITEVVFYRGTDPQSMVGIVMSEAFEWNEANVLYLNMLKEVLQIKLIEVIREKLSGVYSPQIMLNFDKYPKSEFMMGILFGCSPKTTEKLTKAVFRELKKLRKKGPTPEDLAKVKETLLRNRETDLEKNKFWRSKIESFYFQERNPASMMDFEERVEAVTIEELKTAANIFFNPEHYVRVVLMPEKK